LFLFGFLPPGFSADTVDLVDAVARKTREAGMWEAEGALAVESRVSGAVAEIPFRVSLTTVSGGVARARLEVTGGTAPLVRLCDGTVQWTYLVKTRHYWKVVDAAKEPCAYPFTEWTDLAQHLESSAITGRGSLKVAAHEVKCTIAQGDFPAQGFRPVGRRTIWIDDFSHMIWMYRVETPSKNSIETYKFQWQVYAGLPRTADVWQFEPDAGATEVSAAAGKAELDTPPSSGKAEFPGELPRSLYRIGGRVTPPRLIHKVEPQYTKAAQQARVEGTVRLQGEVRPDGTVRNLKVVESLDSDLDQEAIAAVSRWRFQPGTRDGSPVAVLTTFEVNFKLR
jgi:TonB family protein